MQERQMNQKQSVLQIKKAYTFFMVPFYYEEGEWDAIRNGLDKWKPIATDIYKEEDVLYPYIMDLFKQGSSSNKPHFTIYEFQSKDIGAESKMFVERILGKKQIAVLAKNEDEKNNPQIIPFTLLNKKGFSPNLFVSPSARIGILTFPIELTCDKTIVQQINLNYALHKRNETSHYQCICMNPNEKKNAFCPTDNSELTKAIPQLWNENQKTTRKSLDHICWNLNDFVDCILNTMGTPKEGEKRIKYFSRHRMHLFTFCSTEDIEEKFGETEITPYLLRLSRCVNAKYLLPFDKMVEQGAMLQTYENIFFASSIEGAAMMAIGRKDNSTFIDNLHEKFNRQYLLIYMLVLIQRYTLQSLERRITEFEATGRQSDEDLWNLIEVICHIKTNCYFTDVSIYTHHSQFYHLCCNNMHIPETFEEIDEKVELLKLTTDRRMHLLMEAQREIQEEEARKHQEEIERIKQKDAENDKRLKEERDKEEARQKETAAQLKKEQYEAERRQHILNWIVAILTIAQVMQAAYELLKPEYDKDMSSICISVGLGVLCAFLLVMLMRKDIVNFFKNK